MVALLALLIVAPTVFFYFLVIRGSDRYEPEPFWLLSVAFFWGAVVSTLTAIVGNEVGEGAVRAAWGPAKLPSSTPPRRPSSRPWSRRRPRAWACFCCGAFPCSGCAR